MNKQKLRPFGCRLGCGQVLLARNYKDVDGGLHQTCPACALLFARALGTVGGEDWAGMTKAASDGSFRLTARGKDVLRRLRKCRSTFESAWRLGADNDTLREMLMRERG